MSGEKSKELPDYSTSGLNFEETELSLGLPGEPRILNSGRKRGFPDHFNLTPGSSAATGDSCHKNCPDDSAKKEILGSSTLPRKMLNMERKEYVKVAVDGAPYLRKVDLEMYSSYQQLLTALEDMFTRLTIADSENEIKLVDSANGIEYVPTYEDKDGDWMLVGDVPWKIFVESCKRIRLMKTSETIEFTPRTSTICSSTTC